MTEGPLALGPTQLAVAALLLLIDGCLSMWLGLGLERRLLVASIRTVVQLTVMGWVLVPVFSLGSPYLVLAICCGMVILAGREAVRRSSRSYPRVQRDAVFALVVAGLSTAVFATAVILRADPWWEPRYLIGLLGMVLGNALTGISLGLDNVLTQLDEGRARVEALLARGATRWEAARPVAANALRSGMIPILNSMAVVGLVTIPGMMTGQIIAGTPPALAASYQILVMFLIAGATGTGVLLVVLLAIRATFDAEHRLRPERIRVQ